MFIIDLTLKNNPLALSVQRKTAEDAETIYQEILTAMESGTPTLLALTCEFQTGKRLSVRSSEIAAVQVSEKSSTAAASGRPPGFFAIAQ
ncbi:hypothetical protein DO97_17020 [Neosynechococcus sphagnicola sy1]|uniref:UPF0367 protein DO97_17020 n=1 Tax=Neosynechococcus sphagnicola sy1 TaxID=1497020 RepID=A0A098THZ1_9CYAN|nr:hypothetical protein [Neosynechococcus sphagnicola]KGF71636.1 hypothetical protein DO97_17020 [Neosynechococcus sphagnicola sy1]